ncbi:MAG: pyridoxamine 5'-phosphate oxidase family protein [Synergistaceae bacterium]|nr:pyridoxamine 5'-phosphate oxidase family protein [Synergistaceae bacterium]
MKQVVDLFHQAGVFFFATVDGDHARVRPFGFIMEFEGRLYFTTGNKKPVYSQLKKYPHTEMSAMLPDNKWIRLEGKAVFDGSMPAKRKAFEVLPDFKHIYQSPENPDFEVFYLEAPSASICSMTEPPRKIL